MNLFESQFLPEIMKTVRTFSNSTTLILLLISICCFIIVIISSLKFLQITLSKTSQRTTTNMNLKSQNHQIGKLGETMINMLPNDVAFTVFVPSFKHDLKLQVNSDSSINEDDNTYAVVSRILGFSTVARSIYSSTLSFGNVIDLDYLSGFRLCIGKDKEGIVIVNGVRAKLGDLKRGEVVVHVMDGVIMDAEFEQSI